MNNHYDMMAQLDAVQMNGANAHLHYAIREAFRKANMKGQQITTVERLQAFLAPWAFAPLMAAIEAPALAA